MKNARRWGALKSVFCACVCVPIGSAKIVEIYLENYPIFPILLNWNVFLCTRRDLMEELAIYIRDAIDKKQENMRRRRRRDALRLQLVKVFELIAAHGTFGVR